MKRAYIIALVAIAAPLAAACSQETQDAAQTTAHSAAEDTAANLDKLGEDLQTGAANMQDELDQRDPNATSSADMNATPMPTVTETVTATATPSR